jgi:beta-N-acetylhexosaminidase
MRDMSRPLLMFTVIAFGAAIVVMTGALTPRIIVDTSQPAAHGTSESVAAARRMPLQQQVSQLIMTSVPGRTLEQAQRSQLRRLQPGGIIVFSDNVGSATQTRRWIRQVERLARRNAQSPRLLVGVDQEGSPVRRLTASPPTRSHPQLGTLNDLDVTFAQGRAAGRALVAHRININFAPVADVDRGPAHVMSNRSFGRQPQRVSSHVTAFIRGLHAANIAATTKHFPGLGSATSNSDDAPSYVRSSRASITRDLAPFRAATKADADAIMMSHAIYRALDPARPASVSRASYELLHDTVGFEGVAITDALHAAAMQRYVRGNIARACELALGAGADIVLVTGSVADAVRCKQRVLAAVRSGRISRGRVEEAASRVLALKSRLSLLPAQAG